MLLIRRTLPDTLNRYGHAEVTALAAWFWQRRTGAGGGNTRALGGAYLHTWMKDYPTADYASRRTWSLFGLIALIHVDDAKGTLKSKTPGWSLRVAKINPKINFKKVDLYGNW